MQAPSPLRCAQREASAPTSLPRLQDPLRTGREGTTMSQPIFFGYRTALELCRTPGFPAAAQSNASFRSIPGRAPAKGELREALDCLRALLPAFASERPLDCLVGSRSHPHDPGPFQFHACLHRPPTNAFIRLDDLIYVAAPPYAFIQESSRSGLVELYQMEYEICGSYSRMPFGRETRYNIPPLATAASLRKYAQRNAEIRGAHRACKALRYAADGSASPRETQMVLSLGLPTVQGGEGLGIPIMNHEIALTPEARKLCRRRTLRCDMFWPQAKLDVEYQSRERHEGEESRISDSCRTNALLSMGYSVICVTNDELNRGQAIEVIAETIRRNIGKRSRTKLEDLPQRKSNLRRELGLPC